MDTSSSAHRAAAATSSSSSRRSNRWKYEVFLSFRGDDTCTTFTDHLYIALRKAGINTFIDYQLRIIIFSKRYSESRWCLRELSKITRCLKDQEGKIVCPIFYDVDPSQVRKQKDSFGEAFQKHEKDEDPNEVKQWREDLKASADLGGWNLKTTADGREGVFIEKIIGEIKELLKPTDLKEAKHSIGITFRVQEFSTKYLDIGCSPNVQIIGIWGTGGIGKTTLAKAICSKSNKKNMVSLQEQLLRDILKRPDIKVSSVAEGTEEIEKRLGSMKVLVVVDDIDDADQLDKLAITHDTFGPGTQGMTDNEAFELLSWHAFGNPRPDEEYIELARDVVDYCGGLPLALEVVGRLLAMKKSKSIWKSTLDKLRNIPDRTIHETLKLSYDGLHDDHVKGVFLDISCFFIGRGKSSVTAILDGCSRFSVEAEITTLCDRCLLYFGEYKELRMHDLIRDMGREIVRAKSPMKLGKRSRLWHSEDAKSVLRNEFGTEAVEGLKLLLPEHSDDEQSFSTKAFKKMRRLKFLELKNVKLTGSYKHLSKELRSLYWNGFPLEAIPADFDQRNLVYMGLRYSKIVRVWEDSDLLPKKLKYLILGDCHNLTELPDFSKLPHLEALFLSGCKGLCGGYHFLAQLKMIKVLEFRDCNITDGAVLEIIGSLYSLRLLNLGGNGFNRLPILSGLSQLRFLFLNHCTNLQAIPDLPTSLIELHANYCTALEIMSDFSEMSKLGKLELKDCRKLKDIPNLESSMDYMDSIHMEGCTSLTDIFKENLQTKNAFGGIFLSGNDIPNRLAYVAGEDEPVKFEVPPSIDYSSDNSNSTGSLCIDVANRTQRTIFRIRSMEATTVTASHEYYLWLGNVSNKKLNLKGGDMVLVNNIGVDIVKWDLFDDGTNWDNYETMSYESDEDSTMSYESDEDTEANTQLSNRHVFLCYKTPEAWPWHIKGFDSDPLPKFFASALKARKNDINVKTLLTVIEGREGNEFSDGDVLIFPQMIKYRGLKESDVDSFVDDVLVNNKTWASGVQEPLTGPHVFVCVLMSRNEWNRDSARVLIDKFKEEAELRGLTDQVFVTTCSHTEGQKYAGRLWIYIPNSDGSLTCYWGQIGAYSDEAKEINDRELPNGEENKKIEEPQETTKAYARTGALGKLSSLIRNWEQTDVLTATVVVGAVAAVVVAYNYLWLGSLSNRKLILKNGNKVLNFVGWEHVDLQKFKKKKVDYERVPCESDDDTDEEDY
ncbi:TMV resistance protein N-like [Pyrus ussuriensis x Pyrus communis]|uniref:TMV resistance protein N-like n=1 Tax=Pyrus ussuriensis x Pyrus communis TaxID=2448454 RepID=A0A5N5GER9_9ROSA|nr:TMV resistance protein N-like [Pyrus ussuriensis x Pyrus communis]